ncbi:MAG: GNAT family N-acetyltransferase [Acidobacteriota bacterium]
MTASDRPPSTRGARSSSHPGFAGDRQPEPAPFARRRDDGVVVRSLRAAEAAAWRGMTFPAFRPLLDLEPRRVDAVDGSARWIEPLAVGAIEPIDRAGDAASGRPIGLALGARTRDLIGSDGRPADPAQATTAEISSLFVVGDRRRRGLGEALLSAFEEAVVDTGASRLSAVWTAGKPGPDAFGRIVLRRGWSEPTSRMLMLHFSLEQARSTPWYRRYRRRHGLDVAPWSSVSEDELARLRDSQRRSPWIPADLEPWRFLHGGIEPVSSLVARLDGDIVGWVINHVTGPETVRFTCSFIRRDLSRRGRIVPMYSEAIARLEATPLRRCTLTVPSAHPEMQAFLRRWCAPWAEFLGETFGASTDLR